MAQVVVQSGGLEAMVVCLEDFDPGVKEAAAWALGYVGRHNRSMAQNVVDAGLSLFTTVPFSHSLVPTVRTWLRKTNIPRRI